MKGQAFVQLGSFHSSSSSVDDVDAAETALQALHKLVYHTKPLIVSYKRM